MKSIHKTLLVVALAWHGTSYAAGNKVFRCTDGDGHVVFSDTGCGSASQKIDIVQASGGLTPVTGSGLTPQETTALSQINAAEAQAAAQRAQGGGSSSAAAPAPSSSPPMTHGY
ncbi:MAG TPA: DUF4124 domain-containing protein [Pseudomonadales bacterium]|nr:DUF4124 domain-containing protein [Pseudomonadales bacterium]